MYDNTGTIESRKVIYYCFKCMYVYIYIHIYTYITDGASVYMWHECSHSSDVYWFRAKLAGGREGKIIITWGGFIKTFVHNVCI